MTTELESQIKRLKQGDHICAIYENSRERLEVAVPFVIDGLARGERCVYILDESGMGEIVQALTAAGVDVAREGQRGALRFATPEETFLRTGTFETAAMMDIFRQAETDALADGFAGVRITGEPPWSSLGPEPGAEWFEYEALLSHLPTKTVILCRYNQAHFDDSCIPDVLQTHPVAILGNQVCANPYNEPSFVPAQGPQASAEFKRKRATWWITELKRTQAAERERENALEELKQSERKLAQAQGVAHLGYWEYDIDADRVTWSDEVCKIMGVPPPSVRTMAEVRRMIYPQDRPIHVEAWAKALQGSGTYEAEYRVLRPDGGTRFVHSIDEVIRDESGRPHRAFGVLQDITELKRSERRLAEAQQVARIGSWERDLRTNRVTWSDELYRLFGVKADEIELSYERFLRFLVPAEVDRFRSLVDEAIRSRGPLNFDFRITRADGSVRVMHEQGRVIVNAEGEPIRLVGTDQDVTDERRAEEMLEENRRLLHMVLTTLPVGVLVTDRAADVILANPAVKRIWGNMIVSGRERWAQSRGFWHDSGKRIEPESWASARALSNGETSLNELIDIETFDGAQKTIQNSAAPIRNAEGLIVGAVIVNEDVTEQVRAQKARRESADRLQQLSHRLLQVQEEERRHLARELHDEVGQLLTGLQFLLSPNGHSLTEAVKARFEQARAIVDDLLEKVRTLSFELRPAVLDQIGFIPALFELFENFTKRTGVQVRFKHKDVDKRFAPEVETTAYRIVQEALTNVARHAGVRDVTVQVWATQDRLSVQIEDRGRGFDPEAILATPRSSGLAGMRERVMLSHGQLTIDSTPGRGTEITAEIPLERPTDEETP